MSYRTPGARIRPWLCWRRVQEKLFPRDTRTLEQRALEVGQLAFVEHRDLDIPPARDLASDKPGRVHEAVSEKRSSTEQTDLHEAAKAEFVRELAGRINRAALAGRFDRLVLVVPPRVLGQLRPELSAEASRRVVREIGKDLVKQPVPEIEEQLAVEFGE